MNAARRLAFAFALLGPLAACDDGTTSAPLPLYQAPMLDAGSFIVSSDAGADAREGGARLDATLDSTVEAASAHDAGADAGVTDAPSDVGHDATSDAVADAPLESATDASPHPDATDASSDSAAAPCSVDAGTCVPVCMSAAGTTEGWYQANGTLICAVTCAGDTAKCEHVGQGSRGWYAPMGAGCPPHSTEILNDPNCQP